MIPFCSHDKTKYTNTLLKGEEAVFSNWYHSPFTFTAEQFKTTLGITTPPRKFENVEQGMMYGKAVLFGDVIVANKILKTDKPKIMRELGRQVKNYVEETWSALRYDYTKELIVEKFRQNDDLLQILKSTKDFILVEGASYDKVWGVGLKDTDPKIQDQTLWKGQNLLGKALMETRKKLIY
jgi:ribA/ribD-fused uncharacterized protein